MAGCVAPGGLLPGTQTSPRIGNRIVRIEPLLGGVEQMPTPGVGVAMGLGRQQITVSRLGIDACKHGHRAVEKLVVQAHTNGGQIWLLG
jgi:hypothetical protein